MIDDWYDNGEIDRPHRCAAIRAAIEQLASLPDRSGAAAVEDLGRIERTFCTAKASSTRGRRPRPAWVTAGVEHVRNHFVGRPAPDRVTWGEVQSRRWVTVVFAKQQLCGGCTHPPGAEPIRLTHATVRFAPGSAAPVSFGGS
jgi:hypothetical protein